MRKLSLKSQKQLVDLNEDLTLFDLVVSVKSKDAKEFDAVILTQTELDNQKDFDYKKFSGAMQARLVNDKNVYQNYFLCIKSDKPQDVEIDIVQNPPPVPKEEPPLIPPPQIPRIQSIPQQPKKKSTIFTLKTLLIVLAVVGIGVGLYFLWSGSGNKSVADACSAPAISEVVTGDVIPTSPVKVEVAAAPAPVVKTASPGLMSRLKGMVDE